jgi:hypothetical protein
MITPSLRQPQGLPQPPNHKGFDESEGADIVGPFVKPGAADQCVGRSA